MNNPNIILHVDDDPNDVFLIGRAFLKANVSSALEVVNDGEQALAYLSGEAEYSDRARHPLPSLVLLDLKLPRKPGMEVLAWIRSHPELKRLPVVVLTSSKQ
ncbi:MAG: response regulator, partial [Limisphaerales bacterium]